MLTLRLSTNVPHSNAVILPTALFDSLQRPPLLFVRPTQRQLNPSLANVVVSNPHTFLLKTIVSTAIPSTYQNPSNAYPTSRPSNESALRVSHELLIAWKGEPTSNPAGESEEVTLGVDIFPLSSEATRYILEHPVMGIRLQITTADDGSEDEIVSSFAKEDILTAIAGEVVCANTCVIIPTLRQRPIRYHCSSVTTGPSMSIADAETENGAIGEEIQEIAKALSWAEGSDVMLGMIQTGESIDLQLTAAKHEVFQPCADKGLSKTFAWVVGVLKAGLEEEKKLLPRTVMLAGHDRDDVDLLTQQVERWCHEHNGMVTHVFSTPQLLLEAEGVEQLELHLRVNSSRENLQLESTEPPYPERRMKHIQTVVIVEDLDLLAWEDASLSARQLVVRTSLQNLLKLANYPQPGQSENLIVLGTCRYPLSTRLAGLDFHQELVVEFPTELERAAVIAGSFNGEIPVPAIRSIAAVTNGYSRATLLRLCNDAHMHHALPPLEALRNALGSSSSSTSVNSPPWPFEITRAHYSSSQGSMGTERRWAGVGGYEKEKRRLEQLLRWQREQAMGLGIMLAGPSGCGKTLLSEALQKASSDVAWIRVKAAQLASKYLGESERLVRQLFAAGRRHAPCVIFIDEIDALAAKRDLRLGGSTDGSSGVEARVLSTLLNEMDGVDGGSGSGNAKLTIIAATNRLEAIDPALLRPGRFGHVLRIEKPSQEDRVEVLRELTRQMKIAEDVDLEDIAAHPSTMFSTPADLKEIVSLAATKAFREYLKKAECEAACPKHISVEMRHFREVMEESIIDFGKGSLTT